MIRVAWGHPVMLFCAGRQGQWSLLPARFGYFTGLAPRWAALCLLSIPPPAPGRPVPGIQTASRAWPTHWQVHCGLGVATPIRRSLHRGVGMK